MPELNGTGPLGRRQMTGRGFGWCRPTDAPAQGSAVPVKELKQGGESAISQGSVQHIQVCGRGRGGIPCGCGRGYGFGGGRRLRVQ